MAYKAYYSGLIRPEEMNSGESYRVKFSYGTFSIAAKVTQSGTYYYAMKSANGKLHKVYVGRCGSITHDVLHEATMELSQRVRKNAAVGRVAAAFAATRRCVPGMSCN